MSGEIQKKPTQSLRSKHEHRTRRGTRIFRQPRVRNGEVIGYSPKYLLLVKWGGKQHSFPLLPDKRESGRLADQIVTFLRSPDTTPETAMAKFLPGRQAQRQQATASKIQPAMVGDIISRYQNGYPRARSSSKAEYARSLRRIAAFILGLPSLKRKERLKIKRDEWRQKADGLPLVRITPAKLTAFKNALISRAKNDEQRGRAKTSANSYMRNASQFFTPRALRLYDGLDIPDNPFREIEREEEPRHYYQSRVNMIEVIKEADLELRKNHPHVYIAFLLAAFGGLSKSEMDKLLWDQVDLDQRLVIIRTTEYYTPKRRAREQAIALPEKVAAELRDFRQHHRRKEKFLLPGGSPSSRYRAKSTFNELSAWLRGQGFKGKTLHDLRKEAGSLIYRQTGSIDRAANFLRNDPRTAREHYVDTVERLEVNYGESEAATPQETSGMPSDK